MNRPEPIELENNLGPDAVTGEINRVPWMAYDVDEMDLYIAEKDAEIAELKKKLMPCLNGDCILTCEVVEKYGKENAELKAEIESLKASHYAEMVDAGKDEIIDELKEHIDELQKATDSAWSKVNAIYDELRHHKYKRCLGIAAVCFEKSYSTTLVKYDKESGLLRNFYDWWGKRWLELAEKFKEAK